MPSTPVDASAHTPGGARTPAARRNDSTALAFNSTPAGQRSIYLPVDMGGVGRGGGANQQHGSAFDLKELLQRRVGDLGKNVYQTKVSDKVVVLEGATTSMHRWVHVYTHTCTYTHTHAHTHTHTHTHVHTYTRLHTHADTHSHTHTYTRTQALV